VYAIAVNSQIGGSLSLAALSGAAGLSNSSTGSNRFKQESTHFQGDFKGNLDNIPSADANQKTQNPVEGAKE
jgi:hypothetical protein